MDELEQVPTKAVQLKAALQNPSRGSFPVVYEIFISTQRRELAYFEKRLGDLKTMPAQMFFGPAVTDVPKNAEEYKQRTISAVAGEEPDAKKILEQLSKHTEKYVKLKKYFQEKIVALGLEDPLIYFDDEALRVDVGYTLKEFQAFFPDFSLIIESHIHQDYLARLKKERARLSDAAEVEFKSVPVSRKKLRIGEAFSEAGFIEACLKEFQGFVLGEMHHEKSAKQFLIDNMAKLKSQGVTTIYIEHLMAERHQGLIDAYLKSSEDSPMPKELEIYLACLDKERGTDANFIQLVKAVKKAGMRLIAIDTDASYRTGVAFEVGQLSAKSRSDRYKVLNMQMVELFRKHDDQKKYVVFVGSGHVATCEGVPGISDLMECPNLVVYDAVEGSPGKKIQQDAAYEDEVGSKVSFDFLYYRDQTVKPAATGFSAGSSLLDKRLKKSTQTQIHALLKVHQEDINKSLKGTKFTLDAEKHHLINDKDHKIVFYEDGRTQSDLFTELDDVNLPKKLVEDQIAVVKTLQALFRETNGLYPKEVTNLFIVKKELSESEERKVLETITPSFKKILREELSDAQFDDIRHLLRIENELLVSNEASQKLDEETSSTESQRGLAR